MERINMNRKDFHIENYSKSVLVKTYKNGSEDYAVICTCGNCGGRGYVSYSSVDNSRCWECGTTGKKKVIIHVSDTTKPQLTKEQVLENIRKREQENESYYLNLGYKPVDFTLAKWLRDVWFNDDSYYRIIRETEKAYCLGRVDDLKQARCEMTFWVPKSGITFNR